MPPVCKDVRAVRRQTHQSGTSQTVSKFNRKHEQVDGIIGEFVSNCSGRVVCRPLPLIDRRELWTSPTITDMMSWGEWAEPKASIDTFLREIATLPGRRILDAGCRPGMHLGILESKGYSVLGVSESELIVEFLSIKGYSARKMKLANLTLKRGTFSGIWCNRALSGFGPRAIADRLREFHNVLVPGGLLFVSIDHDIEERKDELINDDYEMKHKPRKKLAPREQLENALRKARFDIVRCIDIGNCRINAFAYRSKRRKKSFSD